MNLPRAIRPDGTSRAVSRTWVPEVPVALEFNGLSYAVMMATPRDLEDFAVGFALNEGLAASAAEVADITVCLVEQGWIVRAQLAGLGITQLTARVRNRVAESSCGLCGIENLAEVARPLPAVAPHPPIPPTAIFAALADLPAHQPLGNETGAAHAAAWSSSAGVIQLVREDVGRHNAIDKLVGAMARAGRSLDNGFVLSTARCSYEIVEKTVRAGASTLVTLSLPTTMAIDRAAAAGLSLWVLARPDEVIQMS